MIDVAAQITYWRTGAEEDWVVALELLDKDRVRHSLFIAHLALEKALKAHVCKETRDLAPRIHNLVRLAELAALKLDEQQLDILADMNIFNIHGRYPTSPASPTLEQAESYIARADGVFRWLIGQL